MMMHGHDNLRRIEGDFSGNDPVDTFEGSFYRLNAVTAGHSGNLIGMFHDVQVFILICNASMPGLLQSSGNYLHVRLQDFW
jgi:hypothetical protein